MNEDLIAAAQYLDEHGWTRGDFRDPKTGAVCIVGAIRETMDWYASRAGYHYVDLCAAVDRYVVRHYQGASCASRFNDFLCESKEEAVKVLMGAAEA